MPSWRSAQHKKQVAQKTKWALIILGLLIGLLLIGETVKFTRNLFKPWQSSSVSKNYQWDGKFNINILIKAKDLSLLSYSPQNQIMTLVTIPNNTYLQTPFGFGQWEARSIYALGQSQKEYGGDEFLRLTLIDFFALPIDGFLDFSGKQPQKDSVTLISQLRQNPFSLINILPGLTTNLTPFELIRLKMSIQSLRFDKIKQIDLANSSALQKDHLADGTEILTVDTVKLDSLLADLFDPQIRSEHKTIAIFNSTSHPNLAQKAARLITNLGGDVIITANGQTKLEKTEIFGEPSKTLTRLKQIFEIPCSKEKNPSNCGKINSNLEDLVSSRAQINLLLGEDYYD